MTNTNTYASSKLPKFASKISIASICHVTFDVTYNAGEYKNLSTEQLIEMLDEANVPNYICQAGCLFLVHVGYAA
tara:strand:+ start:475 stop:699 length:225 start_codon:yes stop_codon:yes gene_type:complete